MNKIKNTFKLLLVFLLTFFITFKVEAADSKGYMQLYSMKEPDNLKNMYGNQFLYSIKKSPEGRPNSFSEKLTERRYSEIHIFSVKDSGSSTYDHVYCIQPGVSLSNSSKPVGLLTDLKNTTIISDATLRNRLAYVLTYGYAIPKATSNPGLESKLTDNDFYKMIATQAIIWELVSGERNTFKYYAPNETCYNKLTNCFRNGFYYNFKEGSDWNKLSSGKKATIENNSALKKIYTYYKQIIDSIRYTFEYDFKNEKVKKSESDAPLVEMSWDSTSNKWKYVYKSSKNIFKYYTASVPSSVTASISTDGSQLTITSSKAFDKNSPLVITLTTKATHPGYSSDSKGAYLYDSGSGQNFIKAGYTTLDIYGKLYTPNYQLKITKESNTGEKIKGAKFKLCSDKACKTEITTLETDKDGIALYKKLTKVGTYYLKETYVPAGYILDSTIKSIEVKAANKVGSDPASYATATIKNNVKIFNLTKSTIDETGKTVVLNDGCGTSTYIGPTFEIKDSKGNKINLTKNSNGNYTYASSKTSSTTTEINTCNGKFAVSKLPECDYVITETKAPEGLTLPSTTSKKVNICTSDKNISFVNGFSGLVFNKKNEDGNYISGGKFTLQKKENNVYKDVLLKKTSDAYYEYVSNLTEKSSGATYILETGTDEASIGIFYVKKLPPGEYRVVEKEAPEGYEIIKDKDSTAKVTISDASKDDMYIVELVNSKSSKEGSTASAELVVAINTGRIVVNYILVIGGLALALIIALIVRKKIKK